MDTTNSILFLDDRAFQRVDFEGDLTIQTTDEVSVEAQLTNLSGSGLAFTSSHELALGDELSAQIGQPSAPGAQLEAQLKVVRSSKRFDGKFDIAATISRII